MTELRQWKDIDDGALHAHLRINADDARRMSDEQLEMVGDALWLIEAALRGETTGPLTLPQTRMSVRG